MKITFMKSDAMADRFPDEPDELTIEVPHNVQITYTGLRTTRDTPKLKLHEGDHIAHMASKDYWITSFNREFQRWSDIVIGDAT